MSASSPSRDVYTTITDQIVAAIERGAGDFQMPWHRSHGAQARPWNVASGNGYQGINVLSLWLAAEAQAYPHPIWGTYRQWQAKDAQVRRGERSSTIVFYKTLEQTVAASGEDDADARRVVFARASHVFNAAQVDGYEAPAEPVSGVNRIDPVVAAEELVRASGAVVREGGDRAFYSPAGDFIAMPDKARFAGTPTMTPTESYWAVLLHELTHWSGGERRLKRLTPARFGQHGYAMEELVAELGSSYLCADLGVATALRPDHAAYIQGWLAVMRADKRAIFTAAARAQEAATYLLQFASACCRFVRDTSDETDAPVDAPTRPEAIAPTPSASSTFAARPEPA